MERNQCWSATQEKMIDYHLDSLNLRLLIQQEG